MMRRLAFWIGLMMAMTSPGTPGEAQIPTQEERMLNSSLSPEYATWRSGALQLAPAEAPPGGQPARLACYRKEITLPAAPRQAALTVYVQMSRSPAPYWFAVNGRTLLQPREGGFQTGGLANLDVTGLLRPGRNVLTFKRECRDAAQSWLVVEGIVFCEGGSTHRILSDGWEGGWNAPEGWDRTDAVGRGLRPAPGLAPVAAAEPLRGRPGSTFPRPYYGPIQVAPAGSAGKPGAEPIFDEEKPVALEILLLNGRAGGRDPSLTVEVMDEFSRNPLGQRTISLAPQGERDLAGALDLGKLAKGAYRCRFLLKEGGADVDRRDYEVAVVGEIKQRLVDGASYEDGLDLKEVYSIDCTAPTTPDTFVASHTEWGAKPDEWREVETRLAEGPAGRYRVLVEPTRMLFFAYKYRVKKLYAPHLAVVEWPDDARRNFIVHLKEPGSISSQNSGFQRSEAGLVTDDDRHPTRSNRMQKLHLLFWPNSEEGSIHVCNVGGGEAPAAAARITVYEIANDLPALRIADAGDHLIGPHTERGPWTMASNYYAGPLGAQFMQFLGPRDHPEYYRNWYTTTENWIKRARFSGQNLYLMGHFMYKGTLYPSHLSEYGYDQNNYSGGDAVRDYVGLILRMFERNGMAMVSGVEHFSVPGDTQPTPEEIRKGVSTLFSVSREGKLFPLHSVRRADGTWGGSGRPREDGTMNWPAMNYFHPQVQERFLAIVGDLADRYARYPAWKGVAIFLSRCFGPMEPALLRSVDLLECGYEDYTIDLFEKETGLTVPVDKKDPARFEKRYQWLMGKQRQRWIDWRSRKYTDLFRRMRDRIAQGRPDVKLQLVIAEPMLWTGSQEIMDGHYDNVAYMNDLVRRFGFDLASLKNEPGIVVNQVFALAGSGEAQQTGGHEGWREFSQNDAWQALFANDNQGGAYIKGNIPHYGAYTFPPGRWIFTGSGTRQGWFWSTYVTETLVNVMARSNPTWMPHTWMDVCESMGRIQEQRLFARAYRSLPDGKYEHLTGSGLDRNLWVSRTQAKGAEHAYAANLNWWTPEVTLRFSEGAQVHDLIKDQPLALQGGAWTFRLPPYQAQSFRLTGGRILSAETQIPAADREQAEGEVRRTLQEAREVAAGARAREAELAGKPGWEALRELEGRVTRAQAQLDEGDLAGAYTLVSGALPVARDRIASLLQK
ncbi:MAG: hypothetical protein HY321_05020 [Armatimonadetes bacterium]|nr:hypothetical protein [Armatimonadota bacterium]